jgi:hypothetical protein
MRPLGSIQQVRKVLFCFLLLFLGSAWTGFWERAGAQAVQGTVFETGSRQVIPFASFTLLDTTFTAVGGTHADAAGRFRLEAPEPGDYYLLTEALGYEPGLDGILELGEGGSISVEFFLRPKPIVLDSLVVAMTRTRVYRGLQQTGYYDRFKMGAGSFITPEEIDRRNPRDVADLFRSVPGIQVRREGIGGTRIFLYRPNYRGQETCNPRVYVDGMQRMNDRMTEEMAPGIRLEDLVSVSDIAAVEVHTRATSIPLLYGGTQAGCGAILIWTKAYGGG